MTKLCPHNGVEMTKDAERGVWKCNPVACASSWANAADADEHRLNLRYKASPCSYVFQYEEPMTAAEIMRATGQKELC